MIDETQFTPDAPATVSGEPEVARPSAVEKSFPTEPFACPNCGQMLGPSVRVCVSCRQAVDPSQIRTTAPPVIPNAGFTPRSQLTVKFPWGVFLVFLVLGCVLAQEGMIAFGAVKAVLVVGAMQLLSSIWVFYDAHRKGIAKPFYWGIGSMLFWLPILSWYLVRRRQPHAACPPIEGGRWRFLHTLFLIFAAGVFVIFLLSLLAGIGQVQRKAPPHQPANRGGSIAWKID